MAASSRNDDNFAILLVIAGVGVFASLFGYLLFTDTRPATVTSSATPTPTGVFVAGSDECTTANVKLNYPSAATCASADGTCGASTYVGERTTFSNTICTADSGTWSFGAFTTSPPVNGPFNPKFVFSSVTAKPGVNSSWFDSEMGGPYNTLYFACYSATTACGIKQVTRVSSSTPTPTPTALPNAVCGNGIAESGEQCGEPSLTACGSGYTCSQVNCTCLLNQLPRTALVSDDADKVLVAIGLFLVGGFFIKLRLKTL